MRLAEPSNTNEGTSIMTDIAIINATKTAGISDKDVEACVAALQKQVTEHFAPIWGLGAKLHFFNGADAQAGKIPSGYWWLAVLDDSDTAGALGYHDLTPEGLPMGKAFAGTDIKYKQSWTTTVSHELLEMVADPDINLTVLTEEAQNTGLLLAYEVCDACEDDQFGYKIDGVLVSDFVSPAWFESFRKPGSAKFDYAGKIEQPFQLLSGGYIGVMKVGSLQGWTQITAQEVSKNKTPYAAGSRPRVGSRRERRTLHRSKWLASSVSGNVGVGPGGVNVGVGVNITFKAG
jgi:hypothetical protein